MKKSDKKIDKALRAALTQVCDIALHSVPGFIWLTHMVNFNHFPDSLRVVCVFETDKDLSAAYDAKLDEYFNRLIRDELHAVLIQLNNVRRHISFDTQEACERSHAGRWNERLGKLNLH